MPEPSPERDVLPPDRLRRGAPLLLLVAALGILVAVVWADRQDGVAAEPAEPADAVDMLYLSVTGEGSTAKAWYDGAPSPGVPVQDALDKFSKEGYHLVGMREVNRRSVDATADPTALVIVLERKR